MKSQADITGRWDQFVYLLFLLRFNLEEKMFSPSALLRSEIIVPFSCPLMCAVIKHNKLPYNQSASPWDFNSVTTSSFVTIMGIFNVFSMTSKHYSNCLWDFNCLTVSVDIFINIICMLHWLQYGLAAQELRVQWQDIVVIFHLFCNYMFLTLTRKKNK